MAAYQGGDVAAFKELVSRHERPLWCFLRRFVGDGTLAEDLLQDTFLRVVRSSPDWKGEAKFTTWLYTIAHNRLIDHWRHKELAVAPYDEDEAPAGAGSDPARQAQGREQLRHLEAAIAALPHAQREAFLLHEEAGLTAGEIAAATGSDPEAVKSRLRYAYAKLKSAIDG